MKRRPPLDPPTTISVSLSDRERALILEDRSIPAFLKDRVRLAVVDHQQREVRLRPDDADVLVSYVAESARRGKTKRVRKEFEGIREKLVAALDAFVRQSADASRPGFFYGEEEPAGDEWEEDVFFPDDEEVFDATLEGVPPELAGKVVRILERGDFRDIEELNEEVARAVEEYNQCPQPGTGGLSPIQLMRLFQSDWFAADGPFSVDRSLPLEAVARARIFHNARVFLTAVRDAGGVKATAKGNLTRKFVAEMVERLQFREGYLEMKLPYCKVLNESDLPELERIRIASKEAGFIRRHKGKFLVARAGEAMLTDEAAGRLYASLFTTCFQRLNLAYWDRMPDISGIQGTAPYIFWRLREAGADWRPAEELAEEVLLPGVREEMDAVLHPGVHPWPVEMRVLRTLEVFGLLEERAVPPQRPYLGDHEYRKTDLYDRFLEFRLDAEG